MKTRRLIKSLLKTYNIPDAKAVTTYTKKGRILDNVNEAVSKDEYFVKTLREHLKKYGKPTSVQKVKVDTFDNSSYQRAARNENEYSYSKGERVIVTFKNKEGEEVTLHNSMGDSFW